LDQLAPAATRLTAIQGNIDSDSLLTVPRKLRQARDRDLQKPPDHGFSSITLQLEDPLPWEKLHAVLSHVTTHYAEQLVRLKGVVYTPEHNQPFLVQGISGKLYPPTRLPSRISDDGIGRLVFISHGEMEGLTEALSALGRL
jgi:G3E family GTPase